MDGLVLLPLGIVAVRKMIPLTVLTECRKRAKEVSQRKEGNWMTAAVIVAIWIIVATGIARCLGNLIAT